jgi:hypothetical protein
LAKEKIYLFDHSPHLRGEWDYAENALIGDPELLLFRSNKRAWWACTSEHRWEAKVSDRSKGSSCPFCSNKKILSGYNDIASTHPSMYAEWDYVRNIKDPAMVFAGCREKIWWKCGEGHSWSASGDQRVRANTGCPFCAATLKGIAQGIAPLCDSLGTKFPDLVAEWSDKNSYSPFETYPISGKEPWWVCKKGHEYTCIVANRVLHGVGCARCSNNGTSKVEDRLRGLLSTRGHHLSSSDQPHRVEIPWGRSKSMSVDIEVLYGSHKIIVEYDGYFYHKDRAEKDLEKTNLLLDNNYAVIRLRERSGKHSLPLLNLTSDNLLQLSVEYRKDDISLQKAVEDIQVWIHERYKK